MKNIIKEYRKRANLTQEQLAEKINLSWRQYQRIEGYQSTPTIPTLVKIIETLNLDDKTAIELLKSYK